MSSQLGMGDLLDQDEIWYGRQGDYLVVMQLDQMNPAHLANLRAWLLRSAPLLHSCEVRAMYHLASHVQGEMALLDLDSAIARVEEMPPEAWLEAKPLFEKITGLLAEHLDETHGA